MKKIKNTIRGLPNKKVYFELIAAVLTIPVLITVIILNITNLSKNKKTTPTPPSVVEKIFITNEAGTPVQQEPSDSVDDSCVAEAGPVRISSPGEGDVVRTNPVCVTIAQPDNKYCSIVWAYQLDNADWSTFSQNDICFYNMPAGEHELNVKVRSSQSNDEVILERNFTYDGPSEIVPTTQTASSSATSD